MVINKGDKLVAIKTIPLLNKGEIVEVTDVNDETGIISFTYGDNFVGKGMMSFSKCEECFEKLIEYENNTVPTVTSELVEKIMECSTFNVSTVFDKCTIVACQLPNGFVIVESSVCTSPENYNKDEDIDICLDKIFNKILELESYKLQNMLATNNPETENCFSTCSCGCWGCDDCYCVDDEEFDECLDTDLDCDDCTDYDCPYNRNK